MVFRFLIRDAATSRDTSLIPRRGHRYVMMLHDAAVI